MSPLGHSAQPRSLLGQSLPLFVYSYSSRGFPDLVERLRQSLHYVPSYLLSLYDLTHFIPPDLIDTADKRVRFWDSGGYETRQDEDSSAVYHIAPNSSPWEESDYVEAAKRVSWNGYDVLVSYDHDSQDIVLARQVEQALTLFGKVDGTYLKDLIIHLPDESNPTVLGDALRPHVNEFDVLGLIEKEIAPTWGHGVHFIHGMREALSILSPDRYIPIHVFGCLDPKTVIRFIIAGADIFDGLAWMRYVFLSGSALYKREAEYAIDINQLISTGNIELSIMLHNIAEMERLRSHIICSIGVDDMTVFQSEIADVGTALEAQLERK